jgi:hypothetical protein
MTWPPGRTATAGPPRQERHDRNGNVRTYVKGHPWWYNAGEEEHDKTAARRLPWLDRHNRTATAWQPREENTTLMEMTWLLLKDSHGDTTHERRKMTRLPQEDCHDLTAVTGTEKTELLLKDNHDGQKAAITGQPWQVRDDTAARLDSRNRTATTRLPWQGRQGWTA